MTFTKKLMADYIVDFVLSFSSHKISFAFPAAQEVLEIKNKGS
jgi:hypothetical protein